MSSTMTYLNLNKHCEATMTAKHHSGILLKTYACTREKGHRGPHRSPEGLIWIDGKQVRNEEANG